MYDERGIVRRALEGSVTDSQLPDLGRHHVKRRTV